jgi:hypothetical protein
MDIHKPNPIRNWREFLKEYAIIVIGVLTALGAEQAVEALHKRQRADEARASIHAEIARNLAYMNIRYDTEACVSKRLDEIDGLIAASSDGKLPPGPIWIGGPITFLMQDGKYKAATQAGNVSLIDDREQGAYADIYALFDIYWKSQVSEFGAWNDLRTLEQHPPSSAVLDWQLRSAMQNARGGAVAVEVARGVAIRDAAEIGVRPGKGVWDAPAACIPLHTTREEALKIGAHPPRSKAALDAFLRDTMNSKPLLPAIRDEQRGE